MCTSAARPTALRLIPAISERTLVSHLSVRLQSLSPVLQIRAASTLSTDTPFNSLIARRLENYNLEKNRHDETFAEFRRLDDEINSTENPNSVLRLEHSFAQLRWLYMKRKWPFVNVSYGLTILRMILQANPRISALEPAATNLQKLDFSFREELSRLRKIWRPLTLRSYDRFVQHRDIVNLRSDVVFGRSLDACQEVVRYLETLEKSLPEERPLQNPNSFRFLIGWQIGRLKTVHRNLIDCRGVYGQINVDLMRMEDHRYWVYDAIMYPLEKSVEQVNRTHKGLSNILVPPIAILADPNCKERGRHHKLRHLRGIQLILSRLSSSTRDVQDSVYSLEPFVAYRVKQLSGSELQNRVKDAKETVRLFMDISQRTYPEYGLTTRTSIRTFQEDRESAHRRYLDQQQTVRVPKPKSPPQLSHGHQKKVKVKR